MPVHLVVLLMLGFGGNLLGQLCVPNSTDTMEVILPSDTLEIDGAILGTQVLQIVRPGDTVSLGFTIPIDSIHITNVAGLMPGLQFACQTSAPNCIAIRDSSGFVRLCLSISNGIPLGFSPSYPDYDTMLLFLEVYVETPFTAILSYLDTMSIYYRVGNPAIVLSEELQNDFPLKLQLSPNPASDAVTIDYELGARHRVDAYFTDMLGRIVWTQNLGMQGTGSHQVHLNTEDWPSGAYLLRLQAGNLRVLRRFMKL